MKFNVTYIPYKSKFVSHGSVFLNDTALIFEGSIRRFSIPLIDDLYQNVILVKTIRTVPYSTIFNYKKIILSLKCCQVDYRLPDGKKTGIKFVIQQKKTKVFLNKLEEYMTVVKNL